MQQLNRQMRPSMFKASYQGRQNMPSKLEKPKNDSKISNEIFKKIAALALLNIAGCSVLTGLGIAVGYGISAVVPKQYGGICKSNADCTVMSELGFFCNNGTCGCSNSSYYSSYECTAKK